MEASTGAVPAAAGAGLGAGAGAGAGLFASQQPTRGGAQPPISFATVQGTGAPTNQYTTTPIATQQQHPWARDTAAQPAVPVTDTKTAVAQPKTTSTGVPVHIVAAIAIAVFAITYLFF